MSKDFHAEAKGHASRLAQNHRVLQCVEGIRKRSRELLEIYADEDGSRKDEVEGMAPAGDRVFSVFYERLKEARDYHRKHPGLELPSVDQEEEAFLQTTPAVDFSGEEANGRFLDLHIFHRTFTNSQKFGKKDVTYLDFLSTFSDLGLVPRHSKVNREYKAYVEDLVAYLAEFHRKSQPLAGLSDPLAAAEKEFRGKWERGEVVGWEDRGLGTSGDRTQAVVNLEDFETAADLEAVGADKIKEALVALGLKAGGSLAQKADRLMQTKGKSLGELDRKLFAKGGKPARDEQDARRRQELSEAVALSETKIGVLLGLMESTLRDTRRQVEKKATSTYEELVADMAELEEQEGGGRAGDDGGGGADEDQDEDDIVYNPKNLPLGFDGKPIPYWLYKLHGLNQEFKCEICGNFSYWGRRAFEKHFKEARHLHGMRCLGIPNTKEFGEVTKIDEANALWEAIKKKKQESRFVQEEDEEFEDAQGNVYKRKNYLDLQRQGLL